MIREYKQEDLVGLLHLGKRFWGLTPYSQLGMEYNPEAVAEVITEIADKHYLRIYEVDGEIQGVLGMYIMPLPLNPNYVVATEAFFYIEPTHRGKAGRTLLLQAEADVAKIVDMIVFGDMTTSKDMKSYYEGHGYQHAETTYIKVV